MWAWRDYFFKVLSYPSVAAGATPITKGVIYSIYRFRIRIRVRVSRWWSITLIRISTPHVYFVVFSAITRLFLNFLCKLCSLGIHPLPVLLLPLHIKLGTNGFRRKVDEKHCCTYPGLFPPVCFALFLGTDSLILELAKEPSLPLSFLGGILGSFVVLWYQGGAIIL